MISEVEIILRLVLAAGLGLMIGYLFGGPARLAAQVISGINSLGADAIMRLGKNVKG